MKISVAMTTFNGALFLSEQLDSILTQTRLPDELIVCDDRSDDETPRLLEDYAARAPFPLKVVVNAKRLGSTKNFEKAIGLCSGDIIALSDQDDVWRPHKLATIEQAFAAEPGLGLVFTNGDLIDAKGAPLRGDMWSRFLFTPRLRTIQKSGPGAFDLLLSHCFITGATTAFRSEFRDICLPIPDGIETFVHDRWIAVAIASVARVAAIEKKLIAYRVHPQQQLGVGKGWILRRYLRPHDCSSDAKALALARERLANAASETPDPDFLRALDIRQQHLAARAAFSSSLAGRLKGVAREYLSGRYQRYPLGRRHALKDLFVGTR